MLVAPSSDPSALHLPQAAFGASRPEVVVPSGLLDALAKVPDPRNPRGVRFRLATLLAVGVCALTSAGHNSLTAIAEWVRRCDQDVLARLGCPFDPFAGRFKAPGERTLRDVFARVDPAILTAAGFTRLTTLQARPISATTPDGTVEREQRRVHHTAQHETKPAATTSYGLRRGRQMPTRSRPCGRQPRLRPVRSAPPRCVDRRSVVTFAEDASQIRRHRTPAVMSALRDLARATLRRSGWANVASGEPIRTPQPHSPSTGFHDQTWRTRLSPGPWASMCPRR